LKRRRFDAQTRRPQGPRPVSGGTEPLRQPVQRPARSQGRTFGRG
jgi:hypothetical protein